MSDAVLSFESYQRDADIEGNWYRLVVMTFNLWFITAIVLGIGFGELLFGRHGRGKGH